jgi:hypothetical protein
MPKLKTSRNLVSIMIPVGATFLKAVFSLKNSVPREPVTIVSFLVQNLRVKVLDWATLMPPR